MSATLKELRDEFKTKQARMGKFWEDHPGTEPDVSEDELVEIQRLNQDLNDLQGKIEGFKSIDQMRSEHEARVRGQLSPLPNGASGKGNDAQPQFKTLGQQYTESEGFKSWDGTRRRTSKMAALNAKTLFTTTSTNPVTSATSFAPEVTRVPGFVVDYRLRTPVMAGLIPQGTTNQPGVKYILQSPQTNGSVYVFEADPTLGESAFAYTEKYAVVEKLRTTIPITDETMEDAEMLSDIIDTQLMWMMALKRDAALLYGSGTAPEILGIMNTPGILTLAHTNAEPTMDTFYNAVVKVQTTNFLEPDHIVMHPNDWAKLRLSRTNDGLYIFGSPLDPAPERMWGYPITKTVAITQGTSLVGSFNTSSMEFMKKEVTLEASTEHDQNFVKGILTLKAELRHVLVVYRPSGFCQITGI